MSRSTFRVFALVFGGMALIASCWGIFRTWSRPTAVEWTPQQYALPVTSFGDRLVVYVKGDSLEHALAQGRLTFTGGPAVTPADVTVTFNNIHQDRASRITLFITLAACAGASFMLFVFGLFASSYVPASAGHLTELHLIEN